MRTSLIGLGVAGLAATVTLWPGSASAQVTSARAYVDDDTVYFVAGYGETNDVTVTAGALPTGIVIDDRVPIAARAGCVHHVPDDLTKVTCSVDDAVVQVTVSVDLQDGDDALSFQAGDDRFAYGGPGNDYLEAPYGQLWGEGGDDILADAPFAHGGDGDDLVVGSEKADKLTGGRGQDVIFGLGGHDLLYGNSGSDDLNGGRGDDKLYGGEQTDWLYGNSGNDLLRGGPGYDHLSGGPGDDDVKQD